MEMTKIDVSKEELKDYPREAFRGPLLYTRTDEEFSKVWNEFSEGQTVFGIDTETKPSFKKGQQNLTALVQICNGDSVLVVRTYKGVLPIELVHFFNDERIQKVGIATADDMKDLKKCNTEFDAQSVIDLGKMALKKGLKCTGAKRLSALLLGFTISKSQQTSNWENTTLTPAQLTYAATDAWICNLIYDKLKAI
jgi:ribonuclease D